MVTGQTVLCKKDEPRSNVVDNYRPITCLPVLWKVLTGIIGYEMYLRMEDQAIFLDEQILV